MPKLLWSLVLALAVASPAAAAEQQTLSREQPRSTFEGKKGVGYHFGGATGYTLGNGCHSSGINCETTLVRLTASGTLTAFADSGDDLAAYATFQVLSTRIFQVDDRGVAGRPVSKESGATAVASNLDAGLYAVVVRWVQGGWDYTGRLSLQSRSGRS